MHVCWGDGLPLSHGNSFQQAKCSGLSRSFTWPVEGAGHRGPLVDHCHFLGLFFFFFLHLSFEDRILQRSRLTSVNGELSPSHTVSLSPPVPMLIRQPLRDTYS